MKKGSKKRKWKKKERKTVQERKRKWKEKVRKK